MEKKWIENINTVRSHMRAKIHLLFKMADFWENAFNITFNQCKKIFHLSYCTSLYNKKCFPTIFLYFAEVRNYPMLLSVSGPPQNWCTHKIYFFTVNLYGLNHIQIKNIWTFFPHLSDSFLFCAESKKMSQNREVFK